MGKHHFHLLDRNKKKGVDPEVYVRSLPISSMLPRLSVEQMKQILLDICPVVFDKRIRRRLPNTETEFDEHFYKNLNHKLCPVFAHPRFRSQMFKIARASYALSAKIASKQIKHFFSALILIQNEKHIADRPLISQILVDAIYMERVWFLSRWNKKWETHDVVGIVKTMLAEREYTKAPVLADAIQDAGCEIVPLLNHLRNKPVFGGNILIERVATRHLNKRI